MLRKDVLLLRSQWLACLGGAVVVSAAVLAGNALGILGARTPLVVAAFLIFTPPVAFAAQACRGINKEIKEAAALWLSTPLSGWAMLASKLVSSLIGSLLWLVACYALVLALAGSVNIAQAMPPLLVQARTQAGALTVTTQSASALTGVTPSNISLLLAQLPRIELYLMMLFLGYGVYLTMWILLVLTSVRAMRHRAARLGWVVGLGEILAATWALGALKSSGLYAQLFGWGSVRVSDLFPAGVRSILSGLGSPTLTAGHLAFDAIVIGLLFWITGRIIDRHLEA